MHIRRTIKIISAVFMLLLLLALVWVLNLDHQPAVEDHQIAVDSVEAQAFLPIAPIEKNDWIWGKADAPIELIVYNDISCLFCARFNQVVEQIKTEFPDQVRIAYRHFPLDNQPSSLTLALATECAGEQEKFMEMYQGIMTAEDKVASIPNLVTTLELNQEKFDRCLTKEKYQDKIIDQKEAAKSFGVLGAPASFLNGESLPGAYQFEDFRDQTGREYLGLKNKILQKLSGQ